MACREPEVRKAISGAAISVIAGTIAQGAAQAGRSLRALTPYEIPLNGPDDRAFHRGDGRRSGGGAHGGRPLDQRQEVPGDARPQRHARLGLLPGEPPGGRRGDPERAARRDKRRPAHQPHPRPVAADARRRQAPDRSRGAGAQRPHGLSRPGAHRQGSEPHHLPRPQAGLCREGQARREGLPHRRGPRRARAGGLGRESGIQPGTLPGNTLRQVLRDRGTIRDLSPPGQRARLRNRRGLRARPSWKGTEADGRPGIRPAAHDDRVRARRRDRAPGRARPAQQWVVRRPRARPCVGGEGCHRVAGHPACHPRLGSRTP